MITHWCHTHLTPAYAVVGTASHKINIFGVPDTMSYNNQIVPDIKETVTDLYQTITMSGNLLQGLY